MGHEKKLKRNLALFLIVNALTNLLFSLPIWVAYQTRILTFTQIALFNALLYLTTTVLELPTGALADMIGRKKTIIIGIFLNAVSLFIKVNASIPIHFLFSYLIAGIAGAMVSGADTAILYDTFKELKRENKFLSFSALVGLVIRLSLAVGTLIGGFLYLIDIRFPYLFMGLFYLVSGVIYFWVEEPAIDSQKFTLVNYVKQTKSGLMELVKRPFTKQLSIYYVMVGGITWACLDYFNQPFAKNSGFTEMGMTWLFTFTYTVSAIILYYLVRHAKFLTRQRIYLGLPIIMVLGLLPGIFVPQWLVPVSILLVQIAGSGRFTFLDKFTNMEFESRYRATAISSLNMLVSIFVIILYAISGFIQDLWGTRIIYTGLGILTLIIVLPRAFILIRHHRNNTV